MSQDSFIRNRNAINIENNECEQLSRKMGVQHERAYRPLMEDFGVVGWGYKGKAGTYYLFN